MYKFAVVLALAVAAQATPDSSKIHHNHEYLHQHRPSGIFGTGSSSGVVAPFPTATGASSAAGIFPTGGTAAGSGAGAGGITSGAASQPTGDSTLTYTVTYGDHTSTITTTIHHTHFHTDYVYAHESGAPEEKNAQEGGVTSTRYLTSTSTHYITEYAGETGAPVVENKEAAPASGTGGCVAPSTVTIQGPEVTVTVTAPAEAGATNGPTNGNENNTSEVQQGGESTEVPPYPIPSSKKYKTKCASTGFITKSAKPTGSGAYHHPYPAASGTAPIVPAKKLKN